MSEREQSSAAATVETKTVYVKRWRTLVNLPAKYADEIVEALRAPVQCSAASEAVAWTNEAQLGFLKDQNYALIPMAMWAERVGEYADVPLYRAVPQQASTAGPVDEIIGHLGAILIQTIPSDDQIIIGHVRQAYELALTLRRQTPPHRQPPSSPAPGGNHEPDQT